MLVFCLSWKFEAQKSRRTNCVDFINNIIEKNVENRIFIILQSFFRKSASVVILCSALFYDI